MDVLKQTEGFHRVAYYLDMGLGKTFVGSEKMMQIGNAVNILVCQKSKIEDWINHFKEFYPDCDVIDMTSKTGMKSFISRASMIDCGEFKMVGVINYELTFRRPELMKLEEFTVMLDESSLIQNESAKRSKFILKINPSDVILLSGTPTSGKYEKLWSQLKLLGWNITKELFYKHYVITEWFENEDGYKVPRITGYKNVDRLKDKLRQYGAVFMKSEEVFDLPEMVPIKIQVKPTKEYRKFMRTSIVKIGDIELIGDSSLTKRLYARMLCGQYNQEKLDALKDLFDSTEDRLIVFYNFNEELNAILKIIEDRPVSIVNGSTKDLSAYEEYDSSITLIQYKAGAMGLNLQKANKTIFFTLPEESELFEQSKKRTHRIGQSKTCFYYFPMVSGSVEEDILRNLEMRRDYNDELFRSYEVK